MRGTARGGPAAAAVPGRCAQVFESRMSMRSRTGVMPQLWAVA